MLESVLSGYSLKRLLQGVALGAAATMIVGFNWGGWVLGSTAQATAQKTASTAVISALTPICVQQFQRTSDSAAKLLELKQSNSWEQTAYIEKGGWAAMPGSKDTAVSGLPEACATALRSLP